MTLTALGAVATVTVTPTLAAAQIAAIVQGFLATALEPAASRA